MNIRISLFFSAAVALFFSGSSAWAWGRHDVITQMVLDTKELAPLNALAITPEPIENAAPDLIARVIPDLEQWCLRYHREHDRRYAWSIPKPMKGVSAREALLWALEDNMNTPLEFGTERTAGEILVKYVNEPDGLLDSGLDSGPYADRIGPRMSYFKGNDGHGSGFRHYYVPTSLLPPILEPKGLAPYRADLYAHLAKGAFETGHPYWGFRFLAWSIHYVQDVTQPWHTVFLPGVSFLKFSKAEMKREVSALHYLTEGFADSWMLEQSSPDRAWPQFPRGEEKDPWFVSKIAESLAKDAHGKSSEVAGAARDFFRPIVDQLGNDLKPKIPFIAMGGVELASAELDFSGNVEAKDFFRPVWRETFRSARDREHLTRLIAGQIGAAIDASRLVIADLFGKPERSGQLALVFPVQQSRRPELHCQSECRMPASGPRLFRSAGNSILRTTLPRRTETSAFGSPISGF